MPQLFKSRLRISDLWSLELLFSSRADEGAVPAEMPEQLTYEVVQAYPHDPQAFTQGLIYEDGILFESTGLYGRSSLRRVVTWQRVRCWNRWTCLRPTLPKG